MIPGGPVSPALCIQGGAKPTDKNDGKGILRPGYYGDLAVLSDDFFTVPEQDIPHIESLLTLVGGRIVHAAGASEGLDEEPLAISPQWSPVAHFGGYQATVVALELGMQELRALLQPQQQHPRSAAAGIPAPAAPATAERLAETSSAAPAAAPAGTPDEV